MKINETSSYRKSIRKMVAATALLAVVSAPSAQAATGQTNVSFDFPDIIILHYTPNVALEFIGGIDESVAEADYLTGTAPLAATAAFDAAISPTLTLPATLPTSIAVTLNNVWAVRGITGLGTIDIVATLDAAAATNGGSTVTASALAPTLTTVPAPGFATASYGGVTFDLDITGLTATGVHSGMQYTIEATATP